MSQLCLQNDLEPSLLSSVKPQHPTSCFRPSAPTLSTPQQHAA